LGNQGSFESLPLEIILCDILLFKALFQFGLATLIHYITEFIPKSEQIPDHSWRHYDLHRQVLNVKKFQYQNLKIKKRIYDLGQY
jgi:hypothetical protein